MKFRALLTIMAVLCLVVASHADAPKLMTVQGRLTDGSGNPLPAGFKVLTFKIFDASLGGNEVWPISANEEDHVLNTGAEGLWSTAIGKDVPLSQIVFSDTLRWLQITVDDGVNPPTTLPRVRLVTGPFAFRVATVDGASGGTITSKVSIGPGHTNTGANAFVAGEDNVVSGDRSTVSGGDGNSATATSATIGGGRGNIASAEAAAVGGGISNEAGFLCATVSGGYNCAASDQFATVGGGYADTASGLVSTVAGGNRNRASGQGSTVAGGDRNTASGQVSAIGGGNANSASGIGSTSAGGISNQAESDYATVSGGLNSIASGQFATVGGGYEDTASGSRATVSGGQWNVASGDWSTVGGGGANYASNLVATVAGGNRSIASGQGSTVGGGEFNRARGSHSVVAGGGGSTEADSNSALGGTSTVGGGQRNISSNTSATVSGGHRNVASGFASTVGGGADNIATTPNATVAGGRENISNGEATTVGGGYADTAGGQYSTVPGGRGNKADGNYSLAAGRRAKSLHPGSFVWADATDADFASTTDNQFLIRAGGGVGINTPAPYASLSVNGTIGFKNGTGSEIYMFETGTANADRMIFAHSPSAPTYGLKYQDVGDKFAFVGNGLPAMTVDLSSTGGFVGFGSITAPTNIITLPNSNSTSGRALGFAWDTYSSRRWKTDIETMHDALAKVNRLRGVTYKDKSEGKPCIGLIAEEVGEVVPEVVQYEQNGIDAKSIDYARLTALLIEAVKEQQILVQSQQERIETLEKRLDRQTP